MLQEMLRFIQDPDNQFAQEALATIQLSVIPTILALIIAVPLGILVAPRPAVASLATTLSGLARAVPIIVLLFVVVPYLGLGFVPSALALTLLGIPPILLNVIAGLQGIDPAAIDAARGMGMTSRQILRQIRVPLVLPVLAAGVRTAAVQIVATSPLATFIGGGGFGDYIALGLQTLNIPALLVGAISVSLLALFTEVGSAAVQRAVTPAGERQGAPGESASGGASLANGATAA